MEPSESKDQAGRRRYTPPAFVPPAFAPPPAAPPPGPAEPAAAPPPPSAAPTALYRPAGRRPPDATGWKFLVAGWLTLLVGHPILVMAAQVVGSQLDWLARKVAFYWPFLDGYVVLGGLTLAVIGSTRTVRSRRSGATVYVLVPLLGIVQLLLFYLFWRGIIFLATQ